VGGLMNRYFNDPISVIVLLSLAPLFVFLLIALFALIVEFGQQMFSSVV